MQLLSLNSPQYNRYPVPHNNNKYRPGVQSMAITRPGFQNHYLISHSSSINKPTNTFFNVAPEGKNQMWKL